MEYEELHEGRCFETGTYTFTQDNIGAVARA